MKKHPTFANFVTDAFHSGKNYKENLCLNCKKRRAYSITGVCQVCTNEAMRF